MDIREYGKKDLPEMIEIWNEVVEAGNSFPQEELLDQETGEAFFASQTYTAVAVGEEEEIIGLYIVHPNNIGRCGHICNASFVIRGEAQGRRYGERLVRDCLKQAKKHGFRLMQFNAVVAKNTRARSLYERMGFSPLGTIPKGFRTKSGYYEDICLYYHEL